MAARARAPAAAATTKASAMPITTRYPGLRAAASSARTRRQLAAPATAAATDATQGRDGVDDGQPGPPVPQEPCGLDREGRERGESAAETDADGVACPDAPRRVRPLLGQGDADDEAADHVDDEHGPGKAVARRPEVEGRPPARGADDAAGRDGEDRGAAHGFDANEQPYSGDGSRRPPRRVLRRHAPTGRPRRRSARSSSGAGMRRSSTRDCTSRRRWWLPPSMPTAGRRPVRCCCVGSTRASSSSATTSAARAARSPATRTSRWCSPGTSCRARCAWWAWPNS